MVRKRKQDADNLVWHAYFENIRAVCPWSWSAWQRSLVSIEPWRGKPVKLEPFEARVYIHPHASSRRLDGLCNRFNLVQPEDEFLWSHPEHGGSSTPVPVIIQQDRQYLNSLRTVAK